MSHRLYVGNLSVHTLRDAVRDAFTGYAEGGKRSGW